MKTATQTAKQASIRSELAVIREALDRLADRVEANENEDEDQDERYMRGFSSAGATATGAPQGQRGGYMPPGCGLDTGRSPHLTSPSPIACDIPATAHYMARSVHEEVAPPPTSSRWRDPSLRLSYVVIRGKQVGVFDSWSIAGPLVTGVKGAIHFSLESEEQAWREFDRACRIGSIRILN